VRYACECNAHCHRLKTAGEAKKRGSARTGLPSLTNPRREQPTSGCQAIASDSIERGFRAGARASDRPPPPSQEIISLRPAFNTREMEEDHHSCISHSRCSQAVRTCSG
jgi:hypothetical protein